MSDLDRLTAATRRFNADRDWDRLHDPKSLTLALMGEVGEVAELLQWQSAGTVDADARTGPLHDRLAEELADVLIYLVMLADRCEVDLGPAATAKLADAARRYPADEFRGQLPSRR